MFSFTFTNSHGYVAKLFALQTGDSPDDVVVLNDLTRYYGHQTAIDGITVGVPAGQCFGLLGANGAGKTTTLRLIAGDLLASRGTVLINGHDVRFNVQSVGHFVYKLSLFYAKPMINC